MTNFTRQYSFPNVSVRETVIGPQQFTSVWRNTIGVAAPFNKGPLLANIKSRQELVALYGEDNSIGSVAIRQAMLQGATNFVVSRVLPKAKGASAAISLTDPETVLNEPYIGSTDKRTVGLSVEFSYISAPLSNSKELVGYSIDATGSKFLVPETNTGKAFALEGFEGLGSFVLKKLTTLSESRYDFFLRTSEPSTTTTADLVSAGFDAIAGLTLPDSTAAGDIIKITVPKASILKERYIEAFVPGMKVLTGAAFDIEGVVVSELFEVDALNYAFYAQIEITEASLTSIKLALPEGTEQFPLIDVYQVYWRSPLGYTLPGQVQYFGDLLEGEGVASYPVSYLNINRHDDPGVTKSIDYYITNPTSATADLEKVDSTIDFKVGKVSDSYVAIVEPNLTINVMKTLIEIGETNQAQIDVNPNTEIAFPKDTPVSNILTSLRRAIISNSVLSQLLVDVNINVNNIPYSLNIVLGNEGAYGNNLVYKVKRYFQAGGEDDIKFLDEALTYLEGDITNVIDLDTGAASIFDTDLNFVGGQDDMVRASRFFYTRAGKKVLYIEAIAPGTFGNNIYVNVRPIDQSNFILEVRETNNVSTQGLPPESFYLSNTTVDLISGVYPETLSSNYIRAYYVPVLDAIGLGEEGVDFNQMPARIFPPDNQNTSLLTTYPAHPDRAGATYLQNVGLLGGKQPLLTDSAITEEAYIAAIDRLEDQDISVLTAPGLIAGDVRYERAINALIQQANQASPYNGLRIAVLATPPKLTPSRAEILNSQYSSPNLVLVGGWSTLVTSRGIGINQYSSEGFYAGLLATTDTHISPASSYDSKYVIGVTNLDTDNRLASLDAYTSNNIEMLYLDRVSGKVKFLNGRTTAGSFNDRWVCIKRQTQHLIMSIVRNLEWARSAPNDDDTRQKVAGGIDAILKYEQRRGSIAAFKPTVVNNTDTARYAQGFLDMIIVWTPVFPADYITVELVRSITTDLTLQTSA